MVEESLMKKDNRQLPEDTNIFQKKCNRKLLTSILIFIKVTYANNIWHHFRHQSPSQIILDHLGVESPDQVGKHEAKLIAGFIYG